MRKFSSAVVVLVGAACASAPTSGSSSGSTAPVAAFAATRAVRIFPASRTACPGGVIGARYELELRSGGAQTLRDGEEAGLARSGVGATPASGGAWQTSLDPIASIATGFRLSASVPNDTTTRGDTVVAPTYGCRHKQWTFTPATASYDDRKAFVRLAVMPTPYFDSVVVAVFEVPGQTPDAVVFSPSEIKKGAILVNASGRNGKNGAVGAQGESNSGSCDNAGDGEDGTPGQDGGPGGEVDIIVESGADWLADLVAVTNEGGHGGQGGPGGRGGTASPPRDGSARCTPRNGRNGRAGRDGQNGPPGPPPKVTNVPLALLWSGSPIWSNAADRAQLERLLQFGDRQR